MVRASPRGAELRIANGSSGVKRREEGVEVVVPIVQKWSRLRQGDCWCCQL